MSGYNIYKLIVNYTIFIIMRKYELLRDIMHDKSLFFDSTFIYAFPFSKHLNRSNALVLPYIIMGSLITW